MNKQDFITQLGFTQQMMCSWCTNPDALKRILFTAWVDTYGEHADSHYTLQEPWWGMNDEATGYQPNRLDHDEKFDLVLNDGYEAFMFYLTAEDVNDTPRSIKRVNCAYIDRCNLVWRPDGIILGFPTERIVVSDWDKTVAAA